jgi:hypothetical protein
MLYQKGGGVPGEGEGIQTGQAVASGIKPEVLAHAIHTRELMRIYTE